MLVGESELAKKNQARHAAEQQIYCCNPAPNPDPNPNPNPNLKWFHCEAGASLPSRSQSIPG